MKKLLIIFFIFQGIYFSISAQFDMIIDQNFDSFNSGDLLALVAGEPWTTGVGSPGGEFDCAITNEIAVSDYNSVIVETNKNLVAKFNGKTDGKYMIGFNIRIVSGFLGKFTVLQDFSGSNSKSGLNVFFNADLYCQIDAGSGSSKTIKYKVDSWIPVRVYVDLDNDLSLLMIGGKRVAVWKWSTGASGNNNLIKLDAVNFLGADGTKGYAKFFIDDFYFAKVVAPLESPTDFSATLNTDGTGIALNWTAPENPPTYYILSRNNVILDTNIENISFNEPNLYPNIYNYKIASVSKSLGISNFIDANAVEIEGSVEKQLVLFEVGTGTNCGNCPGVAMACADLLSNNKKVAIIKYQVFSEVDPFYNGVGLIRKELYDFAAFPVTVFDGLNNFVGGGPDVSLYPKFLPFYNKRIAKPALYTIDLSVENIQDNKYEATVKVVKKSDYLKNPVKLFVALTESHVQYNWGNQTEVNERCVGMFPTENGIELNFSGSELTMKIPFEYNFNSDLTLADYELVVFIQEDVTHEVNQTIKVKLSDINIVEKPEKEQIAVYPNPAYDFVTVKAAVNSNVQIIDMNGRVLKTKQMVANLQNIDIKNLNSGIYFIKISSNKTFFVEKIIKK